LNVCALNSFNSENIFQDFFSKFKRNCLTFGQ